jgi:hypothetical protein
MKVGLLLASAVLMVLTAGCGIFGGGSSSSNDLYNGRVTLLLTDNVAAVSGLQRKNQFSPTVPAIDAYLTLANAKSGQKIVGRWYQLGTLVPEAAAGEQIGHEITANNYAIVQPDVDNLTHAGSVHLRLVPSAPLPQDSYMLRVFVDDKLAKTVGFIVSGQAPPASPTPAAGP